jgi:hypothetical protein
MEWSIALYMEDNNGAPSWILSLYVAGHYLQRSLVMCLTVRLLNLLYIVVSNVVEQRSMARSGLHRQSTQPNR